MVEQNARQALECCDYGVVIETAHPALCVEPHVRGSFAPPAHLAQRITMERTSRMAL
jgi:hypothetical protein